MVASIVKFQEVIVVHKIIDTDKIKRVGKSNYIRLYKLSLIR